MVSKNIHHRPPSLAMNGSATNFALRSETDSAERTGLFPE
jgi:hypothetical protein